MLSLDLILFIYFSSLFEFFPIPFLLVYSFPYSSFHLSSVLFYFSLMLFFCLSPPVFFSRNLYLFFPIFFLCLPLSLKTPHSTTDQHQCRATLDPQAPKVLYAHLEFEVRFSASFTPFFILHYEYFFSVGKQMLPPNYECIYALPTIHLLTLSLSSLSLSLSHTQPLTNVKI